MEELKISEQIFNQALELEGKEIEGVDKAVIKEKIERLFDIATKIELVELRNEDLEKVVGEYTDVIAGNNEEIEQYTEQAREIFADMTLEEKIEEKETIRGHLKRALELLVEKGNKKKQAIVEGTKGVIDGMTQSVTGMYNTSIDFVGDKIDETKKKIEAKKEHKKTLKQEAIERLKSLGKDDEALAAFDQQYDEIQEDIEADYERVESIEDSKRAIHKNQKALTRYEKKGFFSRFFANFAELGKQEELTDEQKQEMMANGGVPKKQGFFSRLGQAFSKTRAQGRDIKSKNVALEEEIMQGYNAELERTNQEIEELENILAENVEQRDNLEREKKEKLVEIVKQGNLKARELQEMVDQEILVCQHPHLVVAQAKLSKLGDKLKRIFSWGKDKEAEKTTPDMAQDSIEEATKRGIISLAKGELGKTGMDR